MGFPGGVAGHHVGHGLQLHGINQGAQIHALVQRVAHAQLVHPRAQLGIKHIRDGFMHQQTRPCTADLTLIEPDGIDQPFDG